VATDPERSLLAQTVLVLPRTMVVYDHGIQQQKRVERDDHRDCNGEICPNAHGRPFKDESYYEALALSSPRKFLLSRASTEVGGGESAGEGPREGDDAAPTRPPAPETWRVPPASPEAMLRDSVNDELAGVDRHLGADGERQPRCDDGAGSRPVGTEASRRSASSPASALCYLAAPARADHAAAFARGIRYLRLSRRGTLGEESETPH
jgi:hypothetical protein